MTMTPLQAAEIVGTLSHGTNPITTMDEAIRMCGRYVERVEYLRGIPEGVELWWDDTVRLDIGEFRGHDFLENLQFACDAKAERTGTTAPD